MSLLVCNILSDADMVNIINVSQQMQEALALCRARSGHRRRVAEEAGGARSAAGTRNIATAEPERPKSESFL